MRADLDFLNSWPLERLETLYRIAKRTPFFKHPRDMIYLRQVVERKRASNVVTLARRIDEICADPPDITPYMQRAIAEHRKRRSA